MRIRGRSGFTRYVPGVATPGMPDFWLDGEAAAGLARSSQWPDTRRAQTTAALPPRHQAINRRARGASTAPDTHGFLCNGVLGGPVVAAIMHVAIAFMALGISDSRRGSLPGRCSALCLPALQSSGAGSYALRCPVWMGLSRRLGARRGLTKGMRGMSSGTV